MGDVCPHNSSETVALTASDLPKAVHSQPYATLRSHQCQERLSLLELHLLLRSSPPMGTKSQKACSSKSSGLGWPAGSRGPVHLFKALARGPFVHHYPGMGTPSEQCSFPVRPHTCTPWVAPSDIPIMTQTHPWEAEDCTRFNPDCACHGSLCNHTATHPLDMSTPCSALCAQQLLQAVESHLCHSPCLPTWHLHLVAR